ncbi:GntR family transcriptional regulator (plasmid) [Agrobacterium tumefaciens]|jgi:DNA-binding GntR family transcriptional regulator|uniref:GntR family transcriptional regulator n=1 Tax=Agrobacterium TaxID=357 RepID=UPI000B18B274|nr:MULTISPECIES: GntR family transcriptional regulator [Agrobacterium]UZX45344.1 GntR family transcriptional regulator [Agrobacterium sp. 13-2099-1-2]WCA72753.1 GntR family transcriptional regulator [Agrobacterium tumefaciens]
MRDKVKHSEAIETVLLRRPARLGDEVYDALYAQLMSLKIPPGGRISVDNLVRTLGVSQTPIREALSRLEAQGLVIKTHLIGYSAADQMDRIQLDQLYELRLLLEPFAAGRIAAQRDPEIIADLKNLDAEMRKVERSESRAAYGEFAKRDAAFHNYIARCSGNALVYDSLTRLHTHVHLFRLFYHARATTDANSEHEELIGEMEAGNVEGAQQAMARHIENSKARFAGAFSQ